MSRGVGHGEFRQGLKDRGELLWVKFEREVISARKAAGRKIGAIITKTQQGKLRASGAAGRRLRAVRHIVGRDGTLVMIDHAPLASAQEYGETVTAKSGFLAVGRAGQSLGKPGDKIDGAFTIKSKTGNVLLVRKTAGGELERLAVLMRSVRIKKSLGFYEKIEAMLPRYLDEIDDQLYKGFRYNGQG